MKNFNSYISSKDMGWEEKAVSQISNNGVVVIRDLVDVEDINKINKKVNFILKQPSLLGNIGYYQKEPYKKHYDGFLIDKKVIDIFLNEQIIKIIKDYLKGDILINEVFLKNDLGYNKQYFPYHRHTGVDLNNISHNPFGCGMALYLHDTEEGAFCYSIGSHKEELTIHTNKIDIIYNHPNKIDLIKNLFRINGKIGDIILFDEKGFHGPEQPTSIPRKVILSGYQLKKHSNNKTRTAIPVLISDLQGLSSMQTNAIGIGSGTRTKYESYHLRNLNNNLVVKYFSKIILSKYDFIHKKTYLIDRIKRLFKST